MADSVPTIPPEALAVLRQWPNDQTGAMNQARALAESGDPGAILVAAWVFSQGNWPDDLVYAERLADAGITPPFLQNYAANMMSDANQRPRGIELARKLVDAGVPWDSVAYANNALQQGDEGTASQLLQLALTPAPSGARQAWDQLLAETRSASDELTQAAAIVESRREAALGAIADHESQVATDRERMAKLVQEVSGLAHRSAGLYLAKEYADRAKAVEDSADQYTKWSIIATVVAAVASAVIAFFAFTQEHGVASVLTKAALALPILAVAAYISRLATIHRKQAWRWRHIELQIRTADPFLAPLDEDQRKTLIAALALRFFPGQRAEVADGDGDSDGGAADPAAILAELLGPVRDLASNARGAPSIRSAGEQSSPG